MKSCINCEWGCYLPSEPYVKCERDIGELILVTEAEDIASNCMDYVYDDYNEGK